MDSVQRQSENTLVSQEMIDKTKIVCNLCVNVESNVFEVLRNPSAKWRPVRPMYQKKAERTGDSTEEVAESAIKEVVDMINTMTGVFEDDGIGGIGANSSSCVETEEHTGLRSNVEKVTLNWEGNAGYA